jgi:CheY-like chemotaxis protein
VKFTPPGGEVAVRVGDQPGSHTVEVSDTGVGIPAEFLPHVFERFRQADGSITREHAGLGLGLAIVKELTELHGGSVRADSAGKGRGATFTLRLPRFTGSAARQSLDGEPSAPMPRLDGLSVLVVDDNADSLELASSVLRAVGASVRMATSGAEAVAQWQQAPSQILLCDLAMPRMDGFEVLSRIRRMDAAAERSTAVLALTAYASDEYRARCLRAGFQSRIVKPYDTGDLVRAVAAASERI